MGACVSKETFHTDVTTEASASNEQFHTVVIRGNLPRIKKDYDVGKSKQLPEADYWIKEVINDITGNNWSRNIEPSRFNVQHMISNGPCEFFLITVKFPKIYFLNKINFVYAFRHINWWWSCGVHCLSQCL